MVINTVEADQDPEPDIGGYSQNEHQYHQQKQLHQQQDQIPDQPIANGEENNEKRIRIGLNLPGRGGIPLPIQHNLAIEDEEDIKYPEPTWKASFIVSQSGKGGHTVVDHH
jgi:hypothetical protein